MPLALLRQLAHELLGCLLVLVQQGVLHADVKPENIMVEVAPGGGAGRAAPLQPSPPPSAEPQPQP